MPKPEKCPGIAWTLHICDDWEHRGYLELRINCHGTEQQRIVRSATYNGLTVGELLDVIDASISQPHYHEPLPTAAESPSPAT